MKDKLDNGLLLGYKSDIQIRIFFPFCILSIKYFNKRRIRYY